MPAPRYPAPLQPGSRIAVMATSSGVRAELHPRLDIVLAHLRAQGFEVEEGRCLRSEQHSASAPAPVRAAELQQLLLRDDVDALIPPWGGELAIELLDRLDWTALQRARPKWLLGYSDNSTLLLPITLRLGWATVHGPGLMDLVPGQSDPLTRNAMSADSRLPKMRCTRSSNSASSAVMSASIACKRRSGGRWSSMANSRVTIVASLSFQLVASSTAS